MRTLTRWTTALVVVTLACPAWGGPVAAVTREVVEATVARAAKRGGVELAEHGAKDAATTTLTRLVKSHGNEVLKVVDDAGLGLLEAVPRYGDEVVELALKASPAARRALVQNLPELVPLARRVGMEALELEAKSPGLAGRVFQVFGDDAGRVVARHVPADDLPRLLKYAEKADTPATRKALLETYQKEGKHLFERIPPKLVLATGLSLSMLYGTHEVTGPFRAMEDAIRSSPSLAGDAVRVLFAWGTGLVLVVVLLLCWRLGLMPWHRKRPRAAPAAGYANKPS